MVCNTLSPFLRIDKCLWKDLTGKIYQEVGQVTMKFK
jgi:hypothetical protein